MKSLCNLVDPATGKKPIPSTAANPSVSMHEKQATVDEIEVVTVEIVCQQVLPPELDACALAEIEISILPIDTDHAAGRSCRSGHPSQDRTSPDSRLQAAGPSGEAEP
jgi:hypothetical protein